MTQDVYMSRERVHTEVAAVLDRAAGLPTNKRRGTLRTEAEIASDVARGATLAVVPDIWEARVRHTTGSPEQPVAAQAEQFDLRPRHIRTAIDFAATHREVIEEQIAAYDRAAEQARELAARRAERSRSLRPAVRWRRAISCG